MNISYNWLKDLIDIDLTVEDTAKELTRIGLTVEGIHPHGDDFVLDLDLTSNRPDCLSHLGIARELSVSTGHPVSTPPLSNEIPVPVALATKRVTVEDPDLCNRFTARIIRGVKVGPSPGWLVNRLEAVGERSINNIADITNYVMLELGQPMHAFDLDKLTENRIVVRRARDGEKITTLDEIEHTLDSSVLAICDVQKPVAIGGVIGGLDSCITNATVNVLLEVACFNRGNIRATSRKLGINTEASYRFERGVDIQNLQRASDRATELICQLAGGEKSEFYDLYPQRHIAKGVTAPDLPSSVKRLTGLDVTSPDCERILADLGIVRSPEENAVYIPPSWRHDVGIEEDLVEEIARHTGYEKIGTELPPAFGAGEYQQTEYRKRRLRQTLVDLGFDEAISYSFIDRRNDDIFEPAIGLGNDSDSYVELRDSVIEGAIRMRPTLLPGLLDAVRLNFNQQNRNIRLFEIGRAFAAANAEDGLPKEAEMFALVLTGSEVIEGRSALGRQLDLYDAKGALEAGIAAVGVPTIDFQVTAARHLRKGQSAEIRHNGHHVGSMGRLADSVAAGFKFKQPVYVAELDLGYLLSFHDQTPAYKPLGRFPGVMRDVSLIVPRSLTWSQIKASVNAQQFELCRAVEFVDSYEGQGVSPNERSITLRLEYRSDERTLIEADVEAAHAAILGAIERELGIRPRF